MKIRAVAAIVFVLFFVATTATAQQITGSASPHAQGVSSYTIETAPVEEVLRVEDGGYNSVTYIVTWNGARVGVEDPLCETHYQVGDTIKFMVSRWHRADDTGPKILRFVLLAIPRLRS